MTLTSEQWKEILDAVNLNEGDILEAIKENLKEKHKDTYQEWEGKDFNVNHLFYVSCTIDKEQYHAKLALLHIAAFNGRLGTVKYLVDDKKVSLDQKDNNGRTALHGAAFNGHLDIVKYFVDDKKVSLDQKDDNGETALHWAALKGYKDVVTTLLEKGANPLIKNKNGKTPRDLANDENIIQLLKEAEAKQMKAIISFASGIITSIIIGLTVTIGCSIAGVELPISIIAALVIGVIAGGITYSVSKPSDKLDKLDLEVANQQVPEKA
ncbi:ankyrin repeat domain-containing protein [Wolbachia endosymbiont of Armadillidium arcangelii]|uniref:Ankyrin repeat domain-containing protein n=1 Tax=Wolbachia endosymbiont of Armadillidium arcangelii TaxID=3158571 RepID=A0AAU7Q168_9RICK